MPKFIVAGKRHIFSWELSLTHVRQDEAAEPEEEEEEYDPAPPDPHSTVYSSDLSKDHTEQEVGTAGFGFGFPPVKGLTDGPES